MKIKSLEVKRWFEVTAIMAEGQLEKTMHRKARQLPIFNLISKRAIGSY